MSALAFLLLCLSITVVSCDDSTETNVTPVPGDVALLPCYSVGNVTPIVTSWKKNGQHLITGGASAHTNTSGGSSNGSDSRLEVLRDGSLSIAAVEREDDGEYLCASTLPGNNTFHAKVLLRVAYGPDNVSFSIDPAERLDNGTYTIVKGSEVYFNCASNSYPPPELPSAQGNYSCIAHNIVSHKKVSRSAEVLVYYASDRHPECMWTQDSTFILFHCSWPDVYPPPSMNWTDLSHKRLLISNVTNSLVLKINGSLLSENQSLQCTAKHQALPAKEDRSCTFTLKGPYPTGKPLVTALEGTSITLNCCESVSTPPAVTTWRRGLKQELIKNSSKYTVTAVGPNFNLTIVNVSKEDEGIYFCYSENPVRVKELEVYLTVKSSSAYAGAVIGLFIAVLIVGSAIIIAKTVYSNRHRICLGGFGRMDDDRGDVLSLVDSDDDQLFQAPVPRLPPVSNGCQTTLVEIHRIPSTARDEAETVDANSQQQDATEKTEEPEDLVTF
ncbi:hypothetical protein WMY93_004395 [Mugilogobius chulae]|uniref:Ig-like domain-containing protein n=1 Tax=Mugilogobius chulae TaxID=88201 RepID=A0AAW0PWW0_9GOBI